MHPLSKPVAQLAREIRTVRANPGMQLNMLESLMAQMIAIFSPLAPDVKNRVETEVGVLLDISQSAQS
ncbi:MAG: hypothetical protein WC880_05350 [Candidatus Paceibacterota bacterium]